MPDSTQDIRLLARLSGVAASYIGADGGKQIVADNVLRNLISALYPGKSTAKETIGQRRLENVQSILPKTIIAWDGKLPSLWLWLKENSGTISIYLKSGQTRIAQTFEADELEMNKREIEGQIFYRLKIDFGRDIPYDCYHVHLTTDKGQSAESFLISAPFKLAPAPATWGCFAPAYALHSKDTQGTGGFRELTQAAEFLKNHGADFLGTLPLLPLDDGKAPSPYSPMSRLFLNEIYLDVENLPGYKNSDSKALRDLNQGTTVEHEKVAELKREIIQKAALAFFQKYPEGDEAYKRFKQDTAYLEDYASFRANGDDNSKKYHLYAQYACHLQLKFLKDRADKGEVAQLYLDYPVGVHPSGFDAHFFKDLFIENLSVGAPPDPFFSGGQDWGFRPLHPRKIEENHYAYFRACLRQHFLYAKMLRLDHIMGFYRIYCVDKEKNGSYIYYDFNAFLALLLLEAWRHKAYLIGENLGVVPEIVNIKMEKHGLNRMWIAQFDMTPDPSESFEKIEPAMLAAINTHDMAPFEAFRTSADIEKMRELGLKDKKEEAKEKLEREKLLADWNKDNLYMELVEGIAASPASFVMLTLEDLWKETNSQNLPGTMDNHPNWQRRFAVPFEKWAEQKFLTDAFKIFNKHRGQTIL